MTSETGSRPPITAVRQIPFTQNSFVYLHLYFTVRNSSYQDKSQFWEPEIPRRLLGFSEVPKQEENESPSVPTTLLPACSSDGTYKSHSSYHNNDRLRLHRSLHDFFLLLLFYLFLSSQLFEGTKTDCFFRNIWCTMRVIVICPI